MSDYDVLDEANNNGYERGLREAAIKELELIKSFIWNDENTCNFKSVRGDWVKVEHLSKLIDKRLEEMNQK